MKKQVSNPFAVKETELYWVYNGRMVPYEQIDISGDVGLRIRGATIEELFANAAEGMSDLITDIETVRETDVREVTLASESYDHLLVQWLNELIFFYDTYGFIGIRCDIHLETLEAGSDKKGGKPVSGQSASRFSLRANISGGIFDPAVNESRLLIKAATYHDLALDNIDGVWEATVIFDI